MSENIVFLICSILTIISSVMLFVYMTFPEGHISLTFKRNKRNKRNNVMKDYKVGEVKFLDSYENPKSHSVTFDWDAKCGFGLLSINQDKDGKVTIDSECMGRDFVKQILCKLVDDAVLDTDPIENNE